MKNVRISKKLEGILRSIAYGARPLIIVAALSLFALVPGARAQSSPAKPESAPTPSVQSGGAALASAPTPSAKPKVSAVIDIFVDYSEDIFANTKSIKEMATLLSQTLVETLQQAGHAVKTVESVNGYQAAAGTCLLKVRIVDYRYNGPQKLLYVKYDVTRNGQEILKDKIKLGTAAVNRSGKLARVIAEKIAAQVDQHLQEETGQVQNSPKN